MTTPLLRQLRSTRDKDVLISYIYKMNHEHVHPAVIFHSDTGVEKDLEELRVIAISEYHAPKDDMINIPIPTLQPDLPMDLRDKTIEAARVLLMKANVIAPMYFFHLDGRPLDTVDDIMVA